MFAVRIHQVELPACEPVLVHGNAGLVGHGIDVIDGTAALLGDTLDHAAWPRSRATP